MTRNLQLGIEANWQLMYSASFSGFITKTNDGKDVYTSITEIKPSVVFDKSIIAISITTQVPVGRIWNYAGFLRRYANTGVGEGFVGERFNLFLGKFNLAIFDDLNLNYLVSIQVPKWFNTANVAIYQYEGQDVNSIEQKLDRLIELIGE